MEAVQQFNQDEHTQTLVIRGGSMGKGNVEIKEIPLNKIKLARNSRMSVTDNELAGLMESIKEVGLLQPIGVTKASGGFEIVYGNRRFLAVSKLGIKKIPAIVHENETEVQNDLQNLTENIQRRNISLTEAGRYMALLKEANLSYAEIAVRLGVSKSYVNACVESYQQVPKQYRKDMVVNLGSNDRKRTPGKISISAARAIINATRKHSLSADQESSLYEAAKNEDGFNSNKVMSYAQVLKGGRKDFLKVVKKETKMAAQFWIDEDEHDRLYKKHIMNGPFKTMNALFCAILKGEKQERVKII